MDALTALEKLVRSLDASEKRQVSLLGKMRSGAPSSQHLALFEHICNSPEGQKIPAGSHLQRNLPTTITRLRALILDSLRLLHADRDAATIIATAIADIHNLLEKKHFHLALRMLARPKRIAEETARYTQSLALLELERRLARHTTVQGLSATLAVLADEERALMQRLLVLQRLRDCHERLLLFARNISMPRDPQVERQVLALTAFPELEDWQALPTYVEQALAANIIGLRHLIQRNSAAAVDVYAALLQRWQGRPDWIADQAPLLLTVCNYFQTACFYSKMDWAEARRHLNLVPDFSVLAPEVARDYQRMTLHNQLTPALNTGNLDFVNIIIPTIDAWIRDNANHLSAAHTLPLLHNMAIAKFLMGRYKESSRFVHRVLSTPERQVRPDIRDFALVLRSVLQYEMGDTQLTEYLTRSSKRHFGKQPDEHALELAVLRCLDQVMEAPAGANLDAVWQGLASELEEMAKPLPGTVPILGLTEVRLWVEGKLQQRSITDIFLDAVRENLEALG